MFSGFFLVALSLCLRAMKHTSAVNAVKSRTARARKDGIEVEEPPVNLVCCLSRDFAGSRKQKVAGAAGLSVVGVVVVNVSFPVFMSSFFFLTACHLFFSRHPNNTQKRIFVSFFLVLSFCVFVVFFLGERKKRNKTPLNPWLTPFFVHQPKGKK